MHARMKIQIYVYLGSDEEIKGEMKMKLMKCHRNFPEAFWRNANR